MSILLHAPDDEDAWFEAFVALLPDETIEQWPDVADPDAVELVIAWRHDAEDLHRYPNLSAILALGAGVNQFLDPDYPEVPVVRLADDEMSNEMAGYCVHWVLHFQRRYDGFIAQQADAVWGELPYTPAPEFAVGILGYGTIGRRIGDLFRALGYPVNAWSRSGGDDDGITHFAGVDQLDPFLGSSAAVINVLPHTPQTEGLLNAERFNSFSKGAVLVNLGRGATTVEDDLIAALDAGRVAAAVLDVTSVEPLPDTSPLWTHPLVRITPHASGYTQIRSAARLIAANIVRLRNGEQPFPVLDRTRGY